MPRSSSRFSLERRPLHERLTDTLRDRISQGQLSDPLPAESTLANLFQVSRPVLRQAFRELADEGLIVISQGKRARLNMEKIGTQRKAFRRILAIISVPMNEPGFNRRILLDEIRDHLESQEYQWDEVNDSRLKLARGTAFLDQYVQNNRPDCLLFVGSTEPLQNWAASCSIPALLLGSSFPGKSLPSVDNDYGALGWHAAGRLSAAGRCRVTIFYRAPLRAGDEITVAEMRRFYEKSSQPDWNISLQAVDGSVENICFQIEHHLARERRPDTFFFFHPTDAVTALTHLLRTKREIPNEIAIVSRDSIPIMPALVPELTRYESNFHRLAQHSVQLLQSLSHHQLLPRSELRVFPHYLKGQTL